MSNETSYESYGKYTRVEMEIDMKELAKEDPDMEPEKLLDECIALAKKKGRRSVNSALGEFMEYLESPEDWTDTGTGLPSVPRDFTAYQLAGWYLQEARETA